MSREVRLVARPRGDLTGECFAVVDADDPRPRAGQLVVRNRYLSVDPSMRVRMGDDIASYAPPFPLNAPPEGRALGVVVESRAEGYAPGDTVLHMGGWRELSLVDGSAATRIQPAPGVPEEAYLGVLGAPGLTAYVGLLRIGGLREGDTVWVSAAAGAVGSVVGQLARARGAATVIGSAGGSEKVRHLLDDLGFDHAIDHRAGDLASQLAEVAPQGLDLYFDNVGGRHLEAALASMKVGGRIAVCGMVGGYSGPDDPPRNLAQIVARRVTVQGFLVLDHLDCRRAFEDEVGSLLAQGRLTWRTTMFDGLDQAPVALAAVLAGTTTGKGIVRV